jgi:hypothetical protein
MPIILSEQQRQSLEADAKTPVQVLDEQAKKVYYLISAEQFEKIRALFDEGTFDPRELYPLTAKTAGEAGWNDPAMNAYDRYDEHRDKS